MSPYILIVLRIFIITVHMQELIRGGYPSIKNWISLRTVLSLNSHFTEYVLSFIGTVSLSILRYLSFQSIRFCERLH